MGLLVTYVIRALNSIVAAFGAWSSIREASRVVWHIDSLFSWFGYIGSTTLPFAFAAAFAFGYRSRWMRDATAIINGLALFIVLFTGYSSIFSGGNGMYSATLIPIGVVVALNLFYLISNWDKVQTNRPSDTAPDNDPQEAEASTK